MTTPFELIIQALKCGLWLEARGENLAVLPKGSLANHPELAERLREHKPELLDWISRSVPPDNLPLNRIQPQPTLTNRESVIAYVFEQCCHGHTQLLDWVVRRELAYFDGPGSHWDCALHAYAAARDAACWQTGRDEEGLLELLAAQK
jgi:hypothetical protein